MKIYQLQELAKAGDDIFEQIAIYEGITYEEAKRNTKVSELKKKAAEIERKLAIPERGQMRKWFWLRGMPYRVPYSISEMSAAQYIDLTTFIDADMVANLHNIIAVMICKNGNQKKVAEKVRKYVNSDVALSMAVFFCQYWSVLKQIGQNSLEEAAKVAGLNEGGDGRLLYSE